jgi:hypothetical protein
MNAPQAVPGIPGAFFHRLDLAPAPFTGGVVAGRHSIARTGTLFCTMPEIGTFLAQDGVSVEYREAPGADPGWVTLVLHGTARGALIHQRGDLPLHAATLAPPGGGPAVALCGDSGAGKSTLAAELARRGWALVADDTTRLAWDGSALIAWPSRPRIKLWRDACEAAGLNTDALERVTRDMDKYYLPVTGVAAVRLGTIVELTSEASDGAMGRSARLALVSRHTYRFQFVRPLGMEAQHMAMAARAVSNCAVVRMAGGRGYPLAALADAVEALAG